MRTGAARGQAGHFHEAGFYASDAEFRALIVPFAEEGIAAGEAVIIGYDDRKSALLRSWLSDPSAVEFIGDESLYATPARAIATYRRLFEFHTAMGAGQIRIAGDVPHPGNGRRFEGWDRYEAAVNTVWQDFPVWGRCLYDTTTTPPTVVDVVERTHPRIVSPTGERRESDRYQDALAFEDLPYAPDPLEGSTPVAELVNRPAADARHALARIARGRVRGPIAQDFLIGVTEAVTNAQDHGRPPATVRIWAAGERVVVTVHDTGNGPADRLAGLVPAPSSTPGRHLGLGLWVMHQLDIDVTLRHTGDGFTVRLRHPQAYPDRPPPQGDPDGPLCPPGL
jgi:anti-sigma regulatory factor (Ser/Thr protein kinase)